MKTRYLEVGETYKQDNTYPRSSRMIVIQQKNGYIVQCLTDGHITCLYVPNETFIRPE